MLVLFFFFQAEDGIRDLTVTGVQTCALPIFRLVQVPTNALRVIVVSAVVTFLKLLLPVPRTKTSFWVEQMIPASGPVSDGSDAHVVIVDWPPGLPSARAQMV